MCENCNKNDQQQPLIYQRIAAAMKDIKVIPKQQNNREQHYAFRGIDDVYNVLHPILAKYELFTTTEVTNSHIDTIKSARGTEGRHVILEIKFTLHTIDGSSVSSIIRGQSMDYSDKAINKAMSVAHKYFFLQIFAIPTNDDKDPDFNAPEGQTVQMPMSPSETGTFNAPVNGQYRCVSGPLPKPSTYNYCISQSQIKYLSGILKGKNIEPSQFLKQYNYDSIGKIKRQDFNTIISAAKQCPKKEPIEISS